MDKTEITTLPVGQGAILPSRVPHTITNRSENPLKVYRTVREPGGTTYSVEVGTIQPNDTAEF